MKLLKVVNIKVLAVIVIVERRFSEVTNAVTTVSDCWPTVILSAEAPRWRWYSDICESWFQNQIIVQSVLNQVDWKYLKKSYIWNWIAKCKINFQSI